MCPVAPNRWPWPIELLSMYVHGLIVIGLVCWSIVLLTLGLALLGYPLLPAQGW